MKYPILEPSLSYERINALGWIVTDNISGHEQIVSTEELKFMQELDGDSDPYEIAPVEWSDKDISGFLNFLGENHFIKSRIRKVGFLQFAIPVVQIKSTLKLRGICLILNCLLLVSFLPVFVAGCVLFSKNIDFLYTYYSYSVLIFGLLFGVIFGIVTHEAGHAICGLSYGKSKVYEAGLIVGLFFGAYVEINSEKVKERRRRIQITAGGVEMNLLLSGVSFIFFYFFPMLSTFFAGIGIANIFLAAVNLILIVSLDGSGIFDELLGTESLFLSNFDWMLNKEIRDEILSQGITGHAKIIACIISALFQIAYPALIILNISSFVGLFK